MAGLADYEKLLVAQLAEKLEANATVVVVNPKTIAVVTGHSTFVFGVHDKRTGELSSWVAGSKLPRIDAAITDKLEEIVTTVLAGAQRHQQVVCSLASAKAYTDLALSRSEQQIAQIVLDMVLSGTIVKGTEPGFIALPVPETKAS